MTEDFLEQLPKDSIFQKSDPEDPRLGNFCSPANISDLTGASNFLPSQEVKPREFVIMGYPDDEGVKLNGGRPGASAGPDEIRKHFYKMTPSPFDMSEAPVKIFDIGNLRGKIAGEVLSLEAKHQHAEQLLRSILANNRSACTLGGGHDYGYPDYAAFCETSLQKGLRPLIINFDAHLDVRDDKNGFHSGTPFFRLLKRFGTEIDFWAVGIQDWCNAKAHLNWLTSRGGQFISLIDIFNDENGLSGCMSEKILSSLKPNHTVGLSVCLDAFSSAFGTGASQIFPLGLDAADFIKAWRTLCFKFRPSLISLYETAPTFDPQNSTAKLAAIIIHQWIFCR